MPLSLFSQGFYYNFENCMLNDSNGQLADITSVNDTMCTCGVVDESLILNGLNDTFFMPDQAKEMFLEDFTFGFYFFIEIDQGNQPIFAIQDSCDRDSSLTIRYLPSVNEVELSLSEKLGKTWSPRGELDDNTCWHRFVLTKEGNVYSYYLDNQFIEQFDNKEVFPFTVNSRIYIGSSPCVGVNDILFRGKIDELFLDDRVWSFSEIRNTDFYPDKIITADTTIFAGNSVDIIAGATCSPNFFWTPITDIVNETTVTPTVDPDESTTYFFETNQLNCRTRDSIRINVVDENALDCADLLLPNIFTPNDDQVNDTYGISNRFLVEDLSSFKIYDRMGGLMFEALNKSSTWDGRYNGDDAMMGMYMYQIEYTCGGESFTKQGSFSLMR